MNKKIIIGLCILSFLMVGCGCQKKKENKKSVKEVTGIDVNMDVVKEKEVDGLKFTNVSLITEEGMSTYQADIINISGSTYNIKKITVKFIDKDGKIIDESLAALTQNTLLVDGTSKLSVQIMYPTDITKAKDVEYIISK